MERILANSIGAKVEKRDNSLEEDRISQLPDEILITILSLLSFVEALSTCVLSTRWEHLWTYVKVLNFDVPEKLIAIKKVPKSLVVERPKYVGWVNRLLQLHQGSHITEFKVKFSLDHNNSCDIDEWFNFAIRKTVQRLEVDLQGASVRGPHPSKRYIFPDKVYSLVKSPCGLSCIKSLIQLSLKCVNVTGELLEHFLSNCPLLERLCVAHSELLVNVKVACPSLCLKFLEISNCNFLQSVDIYAPKLASFICIGIGKVTRVLVRHAPSLVDATIGRCYGFSIINTLSTFSSYFSQLGSLTLCLDLFWETYPLPLFPELTNLKNLTLQAFASDHQSFIDWTSLVERSPSLHTFTLQLKSLKRIRRNIQRPVKCLHKCLQVVEFVGNIDSELAMYFVQNAIALQKISVDCRPTFFQGWEAFTDNERSKELRERALELKRELPLGVELVMHPALGIQDPSSAALHEIH